MRLYKDTHECRAGRIERLAAGRNVRPRHGHTAQCKQMGMRTMVYVCTVFRSRDGHGLVIVLRSRNRRSVQLRCYRILVMCVGE